MNLELPPILVVIAVATLAPYLASHVKVVRIPVVVLEIVLGILIGPHVLGWGEIAGSLPYLSVMGTGFLFFIAGAEVDLRALQGPPLRRGILGWIISLALAGGAAFVLWHTGFTSAWAVVLVALTTTALGVLIPILRDNGELDSSFGRFVAACGVLGEIGPILVMSVLLSQAHTAGMQAALTVLFIAIAVGICWLSLKIRPPGLIGLLGRTMNQSGQLPMRMCLLLLAVLAITAEKLGLDLALGAFTAGMAVGLATRDNPSHVLQDKLDAVGFGFVIPIFFVCSGIKLDLPALLSLDAVAKMMVYLVALLLVRGLPALLFYRLLGGRDCLALALYSATSLSLIVVITGAAVERNLMPSAEAAPLVGAGLLSVLLFPSIVGLLRGQHAVAYDGRDSL